MSSDLNQCNFIGRLGKDPESRFMASGEQVAGFSIAVSSQWKDRNGERQESTEWVNCSAFGKLGEICGEYLKKGSHVFVSGRMKTDKYTDKAGVEKYSTKIIVEKMQMLDKKPESDQPRQSKPAPKADLSDMEDDIPFVFNTLYFDTNTVSKAFLRARSARRSR